nr:transposase [Prevotella intermedia]
MLFVDNIHFLTKIEKNMNSSMMSLYEKILLRNRSVIEFLTPNSLYFMSEKKTTKV